MEIMISRVRGYGLHVKYWAYIIATILVFGALIGYIGVLRLHNIPGIIVIDPIIKAQLSKIDVNDKRITSLDTRLTILEHHVDTTKIVHPQRTK